MSSFRLVLILFLMPLMSQAFLFGRRRIRLSGPKCSSKKSCVSCTSHKSWSGSSCRWCPNDRQCHAYGAILANPCSTSENVVSRGKCGRIIRPRYDRNLAYKMVFLSALAYANGVARYISKAREVRSFVLVKQVTKQCPGSSKCSVFLAVSHVERAIAIAFRGSENKNQVIDQGIKILTKPKVSFRAGGRVQGYFKNNFYRLWNDLKADVYRQIRYKPSYNVWVTGHSLGGAMASLASTLLAYEGRLQKSKLFLYTFGQPRVGDYRYALAHDRLVPISFRVVHYRDPVVHLPTCNKILPATPCLASGGPYHHGKEVFYRREAMTKYSSYRICNGLPHNEDLNCSNNFSVWSKCTKIKKCIKDHLVYFGINVGTWWLSQ